LGEIELALRNNEKMEEAVVTVKEAANGDKALVAYLVSKTALNMTDIRSYLRDLLPAYMHPGYYVQLEKLPLTTNGKADIRALPDPEGLGMGTGDRYVAPRNTTESKLVEIWSHILGLEKEKIGVGDSFFGLGGHSLNAISLVSQIYKEFEVRIPLKDVFMAPTIEAIAIGISTTAWVKKTEKVKRNDPDMESMVF